jgi:uncharacterized protein
MASTAMVFDGVTVEPGQSKNIRIKISETYTGDEIRMPIRVIRSKEPGPTVFITAAIHGDEINGTGIIHDFMFGDMVEILKGTLILVPVVNVFGFETHERYLPDRRDLNRSFPGTSQGSLASRMARKLMKEVVLKCDFGIDLHSAAFQRTNFPNVRADLTSKPVRELARAFGAALIVDGKGPVGAFRREATRAGCPTIILEAGEPWKIEPSVLKIGVQGIRNTLIYLGMMAGERVEPPYQAIIRKSVWLRATVGGILKFHVTAGEFVEKDQPIATNYSILGQEQNAILCPQDGIILGIATLPAVKPGEPVVHVAFPNKRITELRRKLKNAEGSDTLKKAGRDLATNIDVVEPASQSKT